MPNRAMRILESVKNNAGKEAYDSIIKNCGTLDEKASSQDQALYVKALLQELENTYGAESAAKVMKPCGHQCIPEVIIVKAKAAYEKSQNLDDFLKLLNEHHVGGGKLHMRGGNIIGIYEKCYCGLPKQVEAMSPLYCNCSAGWYERLFSSVLERDVEVRKLQTILEGSEQCVFEINIGEFSIE